MSEILEKMFVPVPRFSGLLDFSQELHNFRSRTKKFCDAAVPQLIDSKGVAKALAAPTKASSDAGASSSYIFIDNKC